MRTIEVRVELKPEVLDPQGKAILKVLHGLGYDEVEGARVGKVFTLRVADGDEGELERVREMAERVLANTVIERFEVVEAGRPEAR